MTDTAKRLIPCPLNAAPVTWRRLLQVLYLARRAQPSLPQCHHRTSHIMTGEESFPGDTTPFSGARRGGRERPRTAGPIQKPMHGGGVPELPVRKPFLTKASEPACAGRIDLLLHHDPIQAREQVLLLKAGDSRPPSYLSVNGPWRRPWRSSLSGAGATIISS